MRLILQQVVVTYPLRAVYEDGDNAITVELDGNGKGTISGIKHRKDPPIRVRIYDSGPDPLYLVRAAMSMTVMPGDAIGIDLSSIRLY